MKSVLMSLAIGFLAGSSAWAAGTDTPGIDERVLNQERRIQQGETGGQLTEHETDRMNRRLDRIERDEARIKSDGQVTDAERARLNRELNRNSDAIYNQKHDAQVGTASTPTPGIDQRVLNQERRIQDGVNSGQLTGREANRMNGRLDRIEHAEAHAKADGQVTSKERRRLNRTLKHNSKRIYREKHDRQQR